MNHVAFVLVLVGGIALVNALVWVPVLIWLKRKRASGAAALEAELAASGERIMRGPEGGLYRGGSGGYSGVGGNATIMLTDHRLIFLKVTGGRVEVPRAQIVSVRKSRSFRGALRGGKMHVVVSTVSGAEVGFIAAAPDEWLTALG